MLSLGAAGFGLAQVVDHVLALDTLDGRVQDFLFAVGVLVEDRVALGLADLLKDDLLGELGGDAAKDSLGDFGNEEFTTGFGGGIHFAGLLDGDLEVGVLDLLGRFDDGLDGIGVDFAGILVEDGAEIFLRLVILSGGDNDGILDRADDDARVNAFFAAHAFDNVVELTCHKNPGCKVSGFQGFRGSAPSDGFKP